jgi:uncharacterized protein (TIRG00374 family)
MSRRLGIHYSVHFILKFVRSPFTLIISVMVVYVAFALFSDVGKLSRAILRINYWGIPLVLTPITVEILLLAYRFHRLLRVVGINMSVKKSILIYITGLALIATPASSGQIIKSQIIKKMFGYEISKTSPIVLIEKWSELASVLIILTALAFLKPLWESSLIIIMGSALALLLLGIMRNRMIFNVSKRIILRFRRLKKFEESIENSQGALRILNSRRVIIEGFVITLPAKLLEAIGIFFSFQVLGIKLGFITSTEIFFTATISGILSFIPGGIGVVEGSMIGLLIKYYNNNLALLAAAVIFIRLITLWYPTFLGLIVGQLILKYRRILGN